MYLYSLLSKVINTRIIINNLFDQPNKDHSIYFAYVDPNEIKDISFISEGSEQLTGEQAKYGTLSGSWDRYKYKFKKNIIYKISEAAYFDKNESALQLKNAFRSRSFLQKKLKKAKSLIDKLNIQGYKSQYELNNLHKIKVIGKFHIPLHETVVGVDRHGHLVRLIGGRHRLALAQLMDIREIPVMITLVHPNGKCMLPTKIRSIKGNQRKYYRPF